MSSALEPGKLKDGQRDGRLAVEVAVDVVVFGPEFDPFLDHAAVLVVGLVADHIAQVNDLPALARLDDDVFELLFTRQAALHVDRKLKRHVRSRRHRRLADAARRDLDVLFPDRLDHVAGGHVERGQFVRDRARHACCSRAARETTTSPTPLMRARSSLTFSMAKLLR